MVLICYGHGQMSGNCDRCLHLLSPIVEIHMGNTVSRAVIVRISFALIVLNLEASGYSLLTEGYFVPSATADNESRVQVKLVCPDGIAHHLRDSHRWRVATVPKLHYSVAVPIVTNHVDIHGILDRA